MEKCYAVGIHRYCFRAGELSLVIGIGFAWIKRGIKEWRLVYEIEFSDGEKDTIPVSEVGIHWKLIKFSDIINGKIPKVTE
jgi:hypothetical protein